MDTADPVLPQVWRWTTNQLATMLARTNVGLGYVHLPSGLNSEDVAGWDYESVAELTAVPVLEFPSTNRVMAEELLRADYLQADETPVGVQMHDGRGNNHQTYLWQYSQPGYSTSGGLPPDSLLLIGRQNCT
jgi:hypothetical protein